jgi:poly [ADP-ribose] polymerase
MREFEKKFKDKTGLHWVDRGANPKVGKFYTFIERSYVDSDDGEEEDADAGQPVKPGERLKTPESTLPKAVQSLMELIFNQQYFAATMTDLNYDVNKNTIIRGYQALKDLSALLDDVSLAQTQYGTNLQVRQIPDLVV